MALIATDQLIKELCRKTGEPGFHNYTTIEGYVLDAIRDLNLFSVPSFGIKLLPISAFNTFNWPCDCVQPFATMIKRDGHFYMLEASKSLLGLVAEPLRDDSPPADIEVKDLFQIDGLVDMYGWNVGNWALGEAYGIQTLAPPFGLVIDQKKERQSFIRGVKIKTGDQAMVFYKSDGLHECPEFIPAETKNCTEFFVLDRYFIVLNPGLSANMERRYKEETYRLEEFYSNGTEQDWIRAVNGNTTSSPKIT